jgi:hypothetical protein
MTVTAKAGAGAASHHVSDGTSIVWHQTACAVCGLQGQTVQAGGTASRRRVSMPRTPLQGLRSKGLSRVPGRLASTVLRGRRGGNAPSATRHGLLDVPSAPLVVRESQPVEPGFTYAPT